MAINIGENENGQVTYDNQPDVERTLFENLKDAVTIADIEEAVSQWMDDNIDTDTIVDAVNEWLDDHPEATTTIEDGSILPVKLNSTNSPSDGYVLSYNATASKFEWYDVGGELDDINSDIIEEKTGLNYTQLLASVLDEIKNNNIFEGTQHKTPTTANGLTFCRETVHAIHVSGSLSKDQNSYVSIGEMHFEQGKTYTLYIISDAPDNVVYVIRPLNGVWTRKNTAYTFTADTTISNGYIALYQNDMTSLSIDNNMFIFVVEGTYKSTDFTLDKTVLFIDDNLSFMATVSDAVRKNNLFEGSQVKNTYTHLGVTVEKKYMGVHLSGIVPYRQFVYINNSIISLEKDEPYTLYLKGNTKSMFFTIRSTDYETDIVISNFYTRANEEAYIFTPTIDAENVYMTIFQSRNESGLTIDDDVYIYLVKGEHQNSDFDTTNIPIVQNVGFESMIQQCAKTYLDYSNLGYFSYYGNRTAFEYDTELSLNQINCSALSALVVGGCPFYLSRYIDKNTPNRFYTAGYGFNFYQYARQLVADGDETEIEYLGEYAEDLPDEMIKHNFYRYTWLQAQALDRWGFTFEILINDRIDTTALLPGDLIYFGTTEPPEDVENPSERMLNGYYITHCNVVIEKRLNGNAFACDGGRIDNNPVYVVNIETLFETTYDYAIAARVPLLYG